MSVINFPVMGVPGALAIFPHADGTVDAVYKEGDLEEKWTLNRHFHLVRYARWDRKRNVKLVDTADPLVGGEARLLGDAEMRMIKRETLKNRGSA